MRNPNLRREARRLAAQETAGQSPRTCLLCGREMELGCLFPGRKDVFWYPAFIWSRTRETPFKIETHGVSLKRFKAAWFCRSCGKMFFISSGGDGGPAPEC